MTADVFYTGIGRSVPSQVGRFQKSSHDFVQSILDNQIFYEEVVGGFLGNSVKEGKISAREASVRNLFCNRDGLKIKRVVGSERVGGSLQGVGDTFDFV